MIITIDGPTASGKSTVAKMLANKLNIYHLNTGMLYRGLAYILVYKFDYSLEKLKRPDQKDLNLILEGNKFKYIYDLQGSKIIFDGEDITRYLKNSDMDLYSSTVSASNIVRQALLSLQRKIAQNNDIVVEGRDCGSVVFPNADLKIFLTASLDVRAKRWQDFMKDKNKVFTFQESEKIVLDRDNRDKDRLHSPLIIPDGAVVIDSSDLNQGQVIEKIISLLSERKINEK